MKDLERFQSDPRTVYFAKEYKRILDEKEKLKLLAREDVGELVEEEEQKLQKQLDDLEKQMRDIVAEEAEEEANEIILEIRAGAGGDEASLFARDLAQMYEYYSQSKQWRFSPVAITKNNVDGYKEAVFNIKGKNVFTSLQYETGVHRIQRVPATEKSGRVHTSTSSVAILPIRNRKDMTLQSADLKVEFSRSGGAGGQNVNKVESAVRIIHIPTGIDVRCTEERTQLKNRERAMSILQAKVEEEQRKKEDSDYASMRRTQIGTGDRSEKIRTYNVLQDRVTDHRIKKSWHNLDAILKGDIANIITALQEADKE